MHSPSIPVDVLFVDCKSHIRSDTRDRLLISGEDSVQEGLETLVNRVAPSLKVCEYVHRRYSSYGPHWIVSYAVKYPLWRRDVSLEVALRKKGELASRRILVIDTNEIPCDPQNELHIPVKYHEDISNLLNIKGPYKWRVGISQDDGRNEYTRALGYGPMSVDIQTNISPVPRKAQPIIRVEEDLDPFPLARVNLPSPQKSSHAKLKIKLLSRDTPAVPCLLAPVKVVVTSVHSSDLADLMPPGTPANSREMEDTHASSPVLTTVNPPILDIDDTTQEAGLVSMEMDGLRSTPSDEEGTDHRGQMNSFDSTVNHHSEFHGIIQGTIKQIQDSLSRSSYIDTTLQTRELSENNGLSTAWGLSQGLKIEKQHDESVGRNLNLQWQDFGGKEESGELDLDSDPPAKERGIEESISTLYHTQSTVYAPKLLEPLPSIASENHPELDVHLAAEWDGYSNLHRQEYVDLSKDWEAIRNWDMVYNGNIPYWEESEYLICEFVCYSKAKLYDYFHHAFSYGDSFLRKAYEQSSDINIIPELEKLPIESRRRICLRLGEIKVDWPRGNWKIKLIISGRNMENERNVMRVEYPGSMRKSTAEVIPSSYLSHDGPQRFILSIESITPLLSRRDIERMFIIQTRKPTATEVDDVIHQRASPNWG